MFHTKLTQQNRRHPTAIPHIATKSIRFGPFCQKSRNLLLLLFAQLRFSPWVLPSRQGLFALFAATFESLAHGPFRHTECFGDISLLPALVLQVPGSSATNLTPIRGLLGAHGLDLIPH